MTPVNNIIDMISPEADQKPRAWRGASPPPTAKVRSSLVPELPDLPGTSKYVQLAFTRIIHLLPRRKKSWSSQHRSSGKENCSSDPSTTTQHTLDATPSMTTRCIELLPVAKAQNKPILRKNTKKLLTKPVTVKNCPDTHDICCVDHICNDILEAEEGVVRVVCGLDHFNCALTAISSSSLPDLEPVFSMITDHDTPSEKPISCMPTIRELVCVRLFHSVSDEYPWTKCKVTAKGANKAAFQKTNDVSS